LIKPELKQWLRIQKDRQEKPLILLVEDDPEILVLLRDFLQSDYNIIFAENGSEAYKKILSDKPDLIVSDLMMPEMDGIELCCRLRNNFDTSHLPIIPSDSQS